jgi:hypothetical protein
MFTSNVARAALSAAVVGLLLMTLRHANPRASGLAAAVPINSMPALFWLSVEHGGGYAATAALGSLWGTGLAALLGLTFARMAQICNAAVAALLAFLAIGALAALIWALPAALTAATALALVTILMSRVAQLRPSGGARRHTDGITDALRSMGIAGAMSFVVSELSRHGGPQFCGLVATIPVVGMCAVYAGHRQGGAPLMLRVLDGYLAGMLAKAAFLGALFLAWGAGVGPWAWAMAMAGAGVALLAQRSLRSVRNLQLRRKL